MSYGHQQKPYGPGYEDEAEAHYMEKMNDDEEYYCEAYGHPRVPGGDTCHCGAKDYKGGGR